MPWQPSEPGEIPTLGWSAIDWMVDNLAQPARGWYEPFTPTLEQEDFILRWYSLDPMTGKFPFRRGLLGRPRGWGKSPLLASLAIFEALGDCLFDGWDATGQPVGRPWLTSRTPLVQIAAVSETQTNNTWQPLLEMLGPDAPVHDNYPGLDPMLTMVNLPGRGRIEQVTSSASTQKGAPIVFAVLDQTEEWTASNGGIRLAHTLRTNATKNGGRTVESPNAYIPGEGSVAEQSAEYAKAASEGRTKSAGILWDHREAPAGTDMSDRDSLIAGLRVVYGDSSRHPDGCVLHEPPCPPGWVDLDPIIEQIWDPATDPQMARSDFLNQITHASDSWIAKPEWDAIASDETLQPDDTITLGFDGSRGRNRGKADATALIACRVSDGLLSVIDVWEQPEGPQWSDWTPDPDDVDRAIKEAFEKFNVVGFYADPAGWTEQIARWESELGRKLRVVASRTNPIAAWPRGKDSRVTEYVERLRQAVAAREARHDRSPALERHVLNARRRRTRSGYLLYKEFPDSKRKIDAAYAAVLAWKARIDAIAQGVDRKRTRRKRKVVVM